MGRVSAPFGVTGWIKVEPYTESSEGLLAFRMWWLGRASEWAPYRVEHAEARKNAVVAKLVGCDDRDAAALLRGREIAVPRYQLPDTASNEWYWADLIGLRVVNAAGEPLGRLERILRTGANDVLVVKGERERLIPFIEDVIRAVDLDSGVIRVDWDAAY
ncbi:MAG TPA: ribosome maturation factor RimM [Burkholderiales bacterium]|nr:ribosome maturation factor RimM [Burkholderiales bacterium]